MVGGIGFIVELLARWCWRWRVLWLWVGGSFGLFGV